MPEKELEVDSTSFYEDALRFDSVTGVLSGTAPVEFYRRQARLAGNAVLELACGSGRISIPLAKDGFDVTGLDASASMLDLARIKSSAAQAQAVWVLGDMRNFDLGRQFDLIFVASNSFSHLYSQVDVEGCLASVRRHLPASGRFVMEVFNPALGMFLRRPDQRIAVAEYDDLRCGRVSVSKVVRYDSASQISHETWYFRDDTTEEELPVPLNLRMFFPKEIDALLDYNGFRIDKKYSDLQETPFSDSALKQVLICALK